MNSAHSARLEVGQIIAGRYRLCEVLGEGAMGIVWEAEHTELGRSVAIKVLTEVAARAPVIHERFVREARSASRIDHPNVVRVLDYGRIDPGGEPYLVMEFLEGETLDDLIERSGRIAIGEVCSLLRPIAAALDAAHSLGVVHRDVKPANVMCSKMLDERRMVLVDFGIAAVREEANDRRLTSTGTMLGTPAYCAPEVASGERVDARADIYSLACVAFEMLTGCVPHERNTLMGMLTAKLTEPAPRLADVTGQHFNEPLEALFRSALAIDPNERPQSAGRFIIELVRIAEGRGRSAEPPALPKPARPAPRLRKHHATGLALAIGAMLSIALTWAWFSDPDAPKAEASNQRVVVVAEAALVPVPRSESESESVAESESESESEAESESESESVAESVAESEAESEAEAVSRTVSQVVLTRVRAPRVRAERPAQEAAPITQPASAERARALVEDARRSLFSGRLAQAIATAREATYVDPRSGGAWRILGLAEERLGHGPEAARAYRRYLALAPNAPDAAQVRARLEEID